MKANELRIGNLVSYDGRVFEIDTIAKEFPTLNTIEYGIGVVDWGNIEPIPLTEEWLLKFGFESFHKRDFKKKGLFITTYFATPQTLVDDDFGNKRVLELKYVHQLQNLYFALTNEELTMK
jgi:hypothetical protein